MHANHMVLPRDLVDDVGFGTPIHGMGPVRPQGSLGRELLGEGSFMGRGYSIKRCQGFVRCDMDIDAEVVGWVIGKNGEFPRQRVFFVSSRADAGHALNFEPFLLYLLCRVIPSQLLDVIESRSLP